MVFRRSKSRRSNTKRRYTKRRGGSHKRKVYRNKHGRKSYRVKRGGETGNLETCNNRCGTINYGNHRKDCQDKCYDIAERTYPHPPDSVFTKADVLFSEHDFEFPQEYFPPEDSAPNNQPQQTSSQDK